MSANVWVCESVLDNRPPMALTVCGTEHCWARYLLMVPALVLNFICVAAMIWGG